MGRQTKISSVCPFRVLLQCNAPKHIGKYVLVACIAVAYTQEGIKGKHLEVGMDPSSPQATRSRGITSAHVQGVSKADFF